eukprot:2994762-Pleurochrysis_carterae.AAC.1
MRSPTELSLAARCATSIIVAERSHATTKSAICGRAAAATTACVPTPAPTCSTSAGDAPSSRKSALRTAAANVRCEPSTSPRRGGSFGGLGQEKTRRVRLWRASTRSCSLARTRAGGMNCNACPRAKREAFCGSAAAGAVEITPAAPSGISNQKTTALALPSAVTVKRSVALEGLIGGASARKSKQKATRGCESGFTTRLPRKYSGTTVNSNADWTTVPACRECAQ